MLAEFEYHLVSPCGLDVEAKVEAYEMDLISLIALRKWTYQAENKAFMEKNHDKKKTK